MGIQPIYLTSLTFVTLIMCSFILVNSGLFGVKYHFIPMREFLKYLKYTLFKDRIWVYLGHIPLWTTDVQYISVEKIYKTVYHFPNFSTVLRVRRKMDNLNQIVHYEDTPQTCRKYTPQSTASLGTQSILIIFSDQ